MYLDLIRFRIPYRDCNFSVCGVIVQREVDGAASTEVSQSEVGSIKKRSFARELLETLILTIVIFVGVRAVVQSFRVEGESMYPTLLNNELVLVNKALYWHVDKDSLLARLALGPETGTGDVYLFRAPQRGDVIVFHATNAQPGTDYIKRIIGIPGDTVTIVDGAVWVNGRKLTEPYVHGVTTEAMPFSQNTWKVPAGKFFVLGDNRYHSSDSRSWGYVSLNDIIGKAFFSYWPVSRIGPIPGGLKISGVHLANRGFVSLPVLSELYVRYSD
ncbi:signal peptidase I [Thermobaculum terrenum ATCC BAA-798]|uniref:Signal peptidase I n=1 Tax=Thermobaculum terrenum (strain ATCC BAA-798 / CCMEE 7001 / YNP1) TaxID=525904 RepID=D1CFX9_THET1|nr:signal peptidase I [Thermobaculum terrenum ATCC BAA-798]